MSVTEVFELFAIDLAEIDPSKIINLHAPVSMADRVEELVHKKKKNLISSEESAELEKYLALDLLMNLAKAKAYKLLNAA